MPEVYIDIIVSGVSYIDIVPPAQSSIDIIKGSISVEFSSILGEAEDNQSLVDYVQSAVNTVIRDRGNYDASGDEFPSTGGSGDAGAIQLGDQFTISVSGVLGGEIVTAPYDIIRALVDNAGDDRADWYIQHASAPVVVAGQVVVDTITTSPTPTINCDIIDELEITAAASAMVFTVSGTPYAGQKILYRYKDNGTSRQLSLNAVFVDLVGMPSSTTINKVGMFGARWAASRGKWEIIATVTEP